MMMDSLCAPSNSHSPTPTLVETSASEQSELSDRDQQETQAAALASVTTPLPPIPRAGEVSPSSVCCRRKLSTAIATPNANHPALVGRPTVILPHIDSSQLVPPATPKKNSKGDMAIPRPPKSAPPKSLRSGRRSSSKDAGSASGKAVAPMPPSLEGGSNSDGDGQPMSSPRVGRFKIHRAYSDSVKNLLCNTTKFRSEPHPLRLEAWSEPAAETFQIRGSNYMKDRKKVPSEPAAFSLLSVDLVHCEIPLYGGICAHPEERVQKALAREQQTGVKQMPEFIFCVNLCVPGPQLYHQVAYFGVDNFEEIRNQSTPFGRLMHKFIFGDDDEFRNRTFKLIPRIVEGNYVVRKAVGSKPSILGKKIKQYYIRGDRYFELIVDIASDSVAQRIVKLCLGYTKTMVVDMMYVLEGTDEMTLPERILGGLRMKNIDFKEKDGKRACTAMK